MPLQFSLKLAQSAVSAIDSGQGACEVGVSVASWMMVFHWHCYAAKMAPIQLIVYSPRCALVPGGVVLHQDQ
jgi:hypothetical protein